MKILVTGAEGSVGTALVPKLKEQGHEVLATDIDTMSVGSVDRVEFTMNLWRPDVVYHLAGAKHAPEGEQDPLLVTHVNTIGTDNVVRAAGRSPWRAKVVLASTCKAGDPETAYGASKLIAERLVLNAGGVVVRFYNVRETSGNVFRLWESLPEIEPIPWTDCWRYFISLDQAINLMVRAAHFPSGRYAVNPGQPVHMFDLANELYPERPLRQIDRRRGDREREPLHANCETVEHYEPGILRIHNPHDPGAFEESA